MKIKTSNLTGLALDWGVAKARGLIDSGLVNLYMPQSYDEFNSPLGYSPSRDADYNNDYRPERDWSIGGPILTEARISRTIDHSGLWLAYIAEGYGEPEDDRKFMQCDRSELVSGLRCYLASKFGNEVEIPDELL